MKKRQQLSQSGNTLCATIPQKVVEAFDISTKRFFDWSTKRGEIIGTFCQSETVVTTRIQSAKNSRYLIDVLPVYVKQHHLVPTKNGGPMADFEWDEDSLLIRIDLKK